MVVTFFLYIYCYSSSIPKYIMSSFIEKIFFIISYLTFISDQTIHLNEKRQSKKKKEKTWSNFDSTFEIEFMLDFLFICVYMHCCIHYLWPWKRKQNYIIYNYSPSLSLYIVKRQVKILALQRQIIMICFSAHHIIILHHHNNTSVMKTAVLNLMNFICLRLNLNIKITGIQLFVASFNLLIVINCQ